MGKIKVIAPNGGFGNHIIWLILLDNNFPINTRIVTLKSIHHKVQFILDKVYTDSRTWNNWLEYESKYHFWLNDTSGCVLVHHPDGDHENAVFDKIILCKIDPILRYRNLLKFHIDLEAIIDLKKFIARSKLKEKNMKEETNHKHLLYMDNTILWKPDLDKNYYQSIVNFLDIDDNYELANIIHQKWYSLHRKAEQQYLLDFAKIFE